MPSLILYFIAYYYILMASINDGFSGFLLGIPYTLFLLWEILYLKKKRKIKYLHISILLLTVFLLIFDRSQSQIIYPMVGKTYTVNNDINYSYGNYYINKIEVYDRPYYSYNDEQKPIFQLTSGDKFHIENQSVTGHPDMEVAYTYKIKTKNFSELHEYLSNNLKEIKSKLHRDSYNGRSKFYFDDNKQFYINSHELQSLMKSQGFTYDDHRIENIYTYFSFYLFLYPVIFGLFFLLLTFRNKEMFYGRSKKIL